jgi:dihydrofolate synthase/folylpolyglutamate synthase
MNCEEAVAFYHSLERFGIRPGLERIEALCHRLGDPQNHLRCVHVAGTNGKGSTCTEIASVLTEAGYRTGLYTSPYVIDFRERIRLDGEMISPDALVDVTEKVSREIKALSEEGLTVTEFEAITAAAFLYYAESGCDVVVLETGLGGRFDATNIIKSPLCSVITSVSLDHTKILGDTIEKIAAEKCGIIKKGRPVVTAVTQVPSVLNTIRQEADSRGATLVTAAPEEYRLTEEDITGSTVLFRGQPLRIPFPGRHQIENTALTVAVIDILRNYGFAVSDHQLKEGIRKAWIPARIELISRSPLVILDGSHNDGSTSALADSLNRYLTGKRILAVMGMMADKDCAAALDHLLPLFDRVICVTPSNPRSMEAEEFRSLVVARNTDAVTAASPVDGVHAALALADDYDAIVICGSLYLAADVRPELVKLLK